MTEPMADDHGNQQTSQEQRESTEGPPAPAASPEPLPAIPPIEYYLRGHHHTYY